MENFPTPIHPAENGFEIGFDRLKEQYRQRLDKILFRPLQVDNIEDFADRALEETIKLTEEILEQYKTNPVLEGDLSLSRKEQEDDAYKKLELPDIGEILETISKVKDTIDKLKEQIPQQVKHTKEIITPPQSMESSIGQGGEEKFKEKRLFPRTLTLMYILERDLNIDTKNEVELLEGETTDKMMRKTPYIRITISGLNRVVYICDEEGNASYVFDTDALEKAGFSVEEVDVDDKIEKNKIIADHPGSGVRIVQSPRWRERVLEYLENELPQKTEEEPEEGRDEKPASEFIRREGGEFLPFEKFQTEVQVVYEEQGRHKNVYEWYQQEKKNHDNWPSNPNKTYKEKGWSGWTELVGKEKKFLPFEAFQTEVRLAYEEQGRPGNIYKWYQQEQKKHNDWSSNPNLTYQTSGWINWTELVGKEKKFLPFEAFQTEVRLAYEEQGRPGNVPRWYKQEQKKHNGWPSNPNGSYREKGWIGWPALVGKKE